MAKKSTSDWLSNLLSSACVALLTLVLIQNTALPDFIITDFLGWAVVATLFLMLSSWASSLLDSMFEVQSGGGKLFLAIIIILLSILILWTNQARFDAFAKIQAEQAASKAEASRLAAIQAEKDALAEQERYDNLPICDYVIAHKDIYSLERNNEISGSSSSEMRGSIGGSFILGFGGVSGSISGSSSGSIGEITRYYFYRGTSDGGYVLDSAPGSTPLYERNDTAAGIYWIEKYSDYECKGARWLTDMPGQDLFKAPTIANITCGYEYEPWDGWDNFNSHPSIIFCDKLGSRMGASPYNPDYIQKREFVIYDNQVKMVIPVGSIRKEFIPN